MLLEGELTVHIDNLESHKGFQIKPGEFVGEVSIIDGQVPTAYVRTSEPSLVISIHESLLWSEFFLIPGAAKNILQQIATRMRARNLAIQKAVEQSLRLEHLEKELVIAQELQLSMLPYQPFFPNHPQVEVDAFIKPAKEVGGDLYDAFPLDADRVCIAIGDVAGKRRTSGIIYGKSINAIAYRDVKN
ncbi:hypothetical protein [Methylocucumis oryzae]|uniref:Cyclic nucleotide-binding domain-containing protein n=1 Tax=Methylocucumis oryzae TaxID=1632867 RepID=A0A0F3IQ78_9GAMM|nr:hypothetical protein [Methylocucumis oryzae]KJV07729.1 hypothetical protein VZ94_02715 [Methylocucumis oryzae]